MITDHGQNDPIPFVLGEVDKAIARASREAIEAHRQQLNARDRARRQRAIGTSQDAGQEPSI